jgi:tRNA (guanine10-N2)-dimethyltransferase
MSNKKDPISKYFFLLTGENPDLAVYEFESVISLIDTPTEMRISPDKRLIELHVPSEGKIDSSSDLILYLIQRITMVHFCCKLLFQNNFSSSLPLTFDELISTFDSKTFQGFISGKTFSVSTKRIGEPIGILQHKTLTQSLSRFLGGQILKNNSDLKVNLNNPEIKFICIISRHGFWIGQFISTSLRRDVRQRSSHKRPFFHPSSMNPLLQRTMINLAAVKSGDWLLDPFCGSGGALLEASRLGIRGIGIEIDRRMIWGVNKNLREDINTHDSVYLVHGDATNLGIKKGAISGIVTDPPYGTAASTQGFELKELLKNFFQEISQLLNPNCKVVISVPSSIEIEVQASKILNASYKKFYQYVHRSLTRKILVFTVQ